MGVSEFIYRSGNVRLILHPSETMTWGMWLRAASSILGFIQSKAWADLDFDVFERVAGEMEGVFVGTGILTAL